MASIDDLTKEASRLEVACSELAEHASVETGAFRAELDADLARLERQREDAIIRLLSAAQDQGLDFVRIPAAGFVLCYTLEGGVWQGFASNVDQEA